MPSRQPITVGIIGIGFGQQVHVPAFRADARCAVAGICASTVERARAVADRLKIPRAFGDWRAMLADSTIDAVSIALPPAKQPEIVLAAAAAGKHVLCEKPVATNASDARRMTDAMDSAGLAHAVDFLFPEIPQWRQAKAAIDAGTFGGIRHAALTWRVETYAHKHKKNDSWKTRNDAGGGTLNSFVSHTFYYLEWLLGPIARFAARLTPRDSAGDARADLWLEMKAGFPVTVSVAADAFLGQGHRLELFGDQASLILENRSADYVRGFTLDIGTRENGTLAPVQCEAISPAGDGRVFAVAPIARRWIDAIELKRRGEKVSSLSPNLRDGCRVQTLIDAARASDADGKWRDV